MPFPGTRRSREHLKDPSAERRLFASRALAAAILVGGLISALAGRLAWLQIVSYEHFSTLSTDNRVRVVALPPPRGAIYDRNGVLLAGNRANYRIEIAPSHVGDIDHVVERLSGIIDLTEADVERFRKEVSRKRSFQPVPLRFNLDEDEVARFAVHRHEFPGVDIAARPGRYYPQGKTGVHALGYVGRINDRDLKRVDRDNYRGTTHIGKLGVEKRYEDLLHGRVGVQRLEINAQGRTLRVLDEQLPVPGSDLVISLDTNLQRVAEQALVGSRGAVVALDPRTGEVLALASNPGYDPNQFVNGISSARYRELSDDPEQPLFNRALSGQYPPGSTIKPLMALAGLDYSVTTAERTIQAGAYYRLPNGKRRYRDWKRGGHGKVDLNKSIVQSCDVYFYDLAYRMGIERMHDFLERFGLGSRTGLDSTGEAGGLLPSPAWKRSAHGQPWFPGETVISGVGQGYMLATPLQLAAAVSTIATRGQRVQPRLLRAVRRQGSNGFEPVGPVRLEPVRLAADGYWDQIVSAMVGVTRKRNGTAWRMGHDAPYTIAGKTGTAQVFGLEEGEKYDGDTVSDKLRDHALFVAFAPAEDPRIAVAVIVENGGHGGSVAAPVARRVMDYYLLGSTGGTGI
ncbi:MAG: penicillin-binding protein 2 [Gammaproteobacteria bacterium]|jgi:penicillin-binding protein 2|nr:penicillin-binding protein 2 [Gammaproteobacteria bacterium]